jgi:hypothetical protein
MVLLVDAVLFLGPLFVFTDKLWAARTQGVGRYTTLAARYVTEFEATWTGDRLPSGTPLLGNAAFQSMADLGNDFGIAKSMRWITVGPRLLTMLTITALAPFLPLLLLQYPIADLAKKVLSRLIGL